MIRSQRNIVIPAIMQMRHRAPAAAAVPPDWTFTTNCAAGFDPSITKSGAVATWDLGDGSPLQNTNSVSYSYADSSTKTVKLYVDNVTNVTVLDFNADKVLTVDSIASFTNLSLFYGQTNASLVLNVATTTWPSSLQILNLGSTSVTGDISAATWPNTLWGLYLSTTSVSGDVSAATWPSPLIFLYLNATSVSGDVSAATFPAAIRALSFVGSSGISYGGSGAFQSLTYNTVVIFMGNCGLAQAEVDAVLADCVATAITAGYLNLVLNTAPSAAGYADAATLIARGWTVITD